MNNRPLVAAVHSHGLSPSKRMTRMFDDRVMKIYIWDEEGCSDRMPVKIPQ
jgi:hypothetical protein